MTISLNTFTTAWVAGACLCLGVGFLLGWLCTRVAHRYRWAIGDIIVKHNVEHLLEVRAAKWAAAQGLPWAADEVASLLKTTLRSMFASDRITEDLSNC
jgi:hypothetical protein